MSKEFRIALAVAALGLAVVSFAIFREGGDDSTSVASTAASVTPQGSDPDPGRSSAPPEPKPETIVFANGEVKGGIRELNFVKGERIEFSVKSDVADGVHLHGYDVEKEVWSGGTVRFDLPAELEGKFEVELEQSAIPIAEVSVTPR